MLTDNDLARRAGRITSSTAAACLGLDEKMSQIDAWVRIRRKDPTPPAEEKDDDPKRSRLLAKAIQRGNRLEPYILDYGAEYLAEIREMPIVMTRAPFRSLGDWTGDSCDALYWPDDGQKVDPADPWRTLVAIGEGKSASIGVGSTYGAEGTDEMPHHTLIQSHWHLIHWPEVDSCIVPVLVGGYRFEFRCYIVERDEEFAKILLDDLHEWHHRHIVLGEQPPARCSDNSWLMRRFPKALKGVLPDSPEFRALAFAKWRAAEEKKRWEQIECDYQAEIREALGEFERVNGYWGYISWAENQPSLVTDWEAVARQTWKELGVEPQKQFTLTGDNTKEQPGARPLRVFVKKPFRAEAEAAADTPTEEKSDGPDQ